MGLLSNYRGPITYRIKIDNMRGWSTRANDFLRKDALFYVAIKLRDQAYDIMRQQYMSTKSGVNRRPQKSYSYIVNGKRYPIIVRSVEDVLFSQKAPLVKTQDKKGYTIRVVHDYEKAIQQYPHLLWQERGVTSNSHRQAYKVIGKRGEISLQNIREIVARRSEPKWRNKGFRSTRKAVGNIYRLTVPHPKISGRHFIKKGMLWLKHQGKKTALLLIRAELLRKGL